MYSTPRAMNVAVKGMIARAVSSELQILIIRCARASLIGSNSPLRLAMLLLMMIVVLKNEAEIGKGRNS